MLIDIVVWLLFDSEKHTTRDINSHNSRLTSFQNGDYESGSLFKLMSRVVCSVSNKSEITIAQKSTTTLHSKCDSTEQCDILGSVQSDTIVVGSRFQFSENIYCSYTPTVPLGRLFPYPVSI
jgi:hypothetical protein